MSRSRVNQIRRWVTAIGISGFVSFCAFVLDESVFCQTCPRFVATDGNRSVMIGPTLSVDGCAVLDRSYLLRSATVRVDARAEVSGHCRYQLLSGFPAVCTVVSETDRTVNAIGVKYYKPGNATEFSLGTINGKDPILGTTPYYMQVLDSEDLETSTGPLSYLPVLFGQHTLGAQATINTTVCNILPSTTPKESVSFYSVDCVPKFNGQTNDDGSIVIVHLPEGERKI